MEFHPRYFSGQPTQAFIDNNKLDSPTTNILTDSTNRMTPGGTDTLYERQESVRDIAIGRRHLLNPKGIQFDNNITSKATKLPKRDARDLIGALPEEPKIQGIKEGFQGSSLGPIIKSTFIFIVLYYLLDQLF